MGFNYGTILHTPVKVNAYTYTSFSGSTFDTRKELRFRKGSLVPFSFFNGKRMVKGRCVVVIDNENTFEHKGKTLFNFDASILPF